MPTANNLIKNISNKTTYRRTRINFFNVNKPTSNNKPHSLTKHDIQNITASCLYLATKYEEIYPPEMEYFCKIPQKEMSNNQLAELECKIVNALQFNLSVPTLANWLNIYLYD